MRGPRALVGYVVHGLRLPLPHGPPGRPGATTHRGGLYAPAGLRARPARPVDQQVTAFPLQTRTHVTPLLCFDDPRCGREERAVTLWAWTGRAPEPLPPGVGPGARPQGQSSRAGSASCHSGWPGQAAAPPSSPGSHSPSAAASAVGHSVGSSRGHGPSLEGRLTPVLGPESA